ARIVSGGSGHLETLRIALALLAAAVPAQHDLRRGIGRLLEDLRFPREARLSDRSPALALLDRLRGMAIGRMVQLVAEHTRELRFGGRGLQESACDVDIPSGNREGVRRV